MQHTKLFSALATLGVIALWGGPAQAALVFSTTPDPSTASPGGTGFFDVVLSDTDLAGSSAYQVGGFTFGLDAPPTSGVTFTDVTMNTTSPYIFSGASFDADNGLPLAVNTLPSTSVIASDTSDNFAGYVDLSPGETVGLGQVDYSVATGTALGPVPITFDLGTTSLADGSGNPLVSSVVSGTINVSPAPEPAEFVTAGAFALGLAVMVLRARRSRKLSA